MADQTAGVTDPKKLAEMEKETMVTKCLNKFQPIFCSSKADELD